MNTSQILAVAATLLHATRHADPGAAGDAAIKIVNRFVPLCGATQADLILASAPYAIGVACRGCDWPVSLHRVEPISKGEPA